MGAKLDPVTTFTLRWDGAADLDLAALYITTQGQRGLVYYGDPGELAEAPWIELPADVTGSGEENAELLRVGSLADKQAVHLYCWQWEKVDAGEAGWLEFDLEVRGQVHHFAGPGNTVHLGTLTEAGFQPNGHFAMLMGVDDLDTLEALSTRPPSGFDHRGTKPS